MQTMCMAVMTCRPRDSGEIEDPRRTGLSLATSNGTGIGRRVVAGSIANQLRRFKFTFGNP
jgi:hypothetical protein